MTQKKLAALLEKCGYRRLFAGTLAVLIESKGKALTAKQLEREVDARQPEISIALAQLVEKKWIKVSTVEAMEGKKGRPTFAYEVIPVERLYEIISAEQTKLISDVEKTLLELKAVMIQTKPVSGEIPHVSGKQLNLM